MLPRSLFYNYPSDELRNLPMIRSNLSESIDYILSREGFFYGEVLKESSLMYIKHYGW